MFHRQEYTPEELDILIKKGWESVSTGKMHGGYNKLIKQANQFVLFTWMEDDDGGYWDEWADNIYDKVEDVPHVN
jgi:hypothetical protein